MNVRRFLILSGILLAIISCGGNRNQPKVALEESSLSNSVLTVEEQRNLTPDQVITLLQLGNVDFSNDSPHCAKSPILKEMEGKGEIKIIGAIYDIYTDILVYI